MSVSGAPVYDSLLRPNNQYFCGPIFALSKYGLKRLHRYILVVLLLLMMVFLSDSLWIYTKAELAQYLIKDAWQKTVLQKNVSHKNVPKNKNVPKKKLNQSVVDSFDQVKPWPWADTWPVGRLQSTKYDVDLYILNGVQGNALAFGPGYLQGSAPLGSESSSIIAGHRDTHFRFMQRLEKDDLLQLTTIEGRILTYKITALEVVDSSEEPLYAEQDLAQIILVTCYPFDVIEPGGPLRYVAKAIAIPSGNTHLTNDENHYD